jgi:predicted RNase H-like nuclease (RuvC/YqgF family)
MYNSFLSLFRPGLPRAPRDAVATSMNGFVILSIGFALTVSHDQAENAGLRGEVDALRELTAVLTRELDESQRECKDARGKLEGAAMREAECRRLLEERMEEHREAAEEYAMLCQEEVRALVVKSCAVDIVSIESSLRNYIPSYSK